MCYCKVFGKCRDLPKKKKGQNENHLIFYNTDITMVNVAIDLFQ